MNKDFAVLGLSASKELVKEICECLDCTPFPVEVKHFADGEIMVEIGATVRGKHVYIVQSTCNPVSSNLMETLICIDACKRASASEITVICPYFGYARQDRKAAPRQPITAKLVADLLQTAGADRAVSRNGKSITVPQCRPFPASVALPGRSELFCRCIADTPGCNFTASAMPLHRRPCRSRRAEYRSTDIPAAIFHFPTADMKPFAGNNSALKS